ncbi:hypothetical protein NQ318_008396, partial [Aromia moschata]
HFRALENLELPVNNWDAILIYLLMTKLDFVTKKEWESKTGDVEIPTIEQFNLLTQKVKIDLWQKKGQVQQSHITASGVACNFCKGNHYIFACKQFLELDKPTRLTKLKNKRLCTNCLRHGHSNLECRSSGCKICNKRHNSLLHIERQNNASVSNNSGKNTSPKKSASTSSSQEQINSTTKDSKDVTISTHCNQHKFENFVLLSTAVISIFDSQNKPIKCRALLDSGSQSNFITQELFEKLNLPSTKVDIPVQGINSATVKISQKTLATFKSLCNVPQHTINCSNLNIPENLKLADPDFHKTSFLSTRCLVQLARENKTTYPIASQTFENDFYVDDLITGTPDIASATNLFNELNTIMQSACLELRKWVSNKPEVLENATVQNNTDSNFIITNPNVTNIFSKYSSFSKLQRITSYCIRFMQNAKKQKSDRNVGSLNIEDITKGILAAKC